MDACDCHAAPRAAQASPSGRPPLMMSVLEMLASAAPGDGLSNIVQSFQQAGLGDVVSSWVGTGRNASISSTELKRGLGADRVRQLAESSGMSMNGAARILSELLPPVIDHLTPAGTVPDSEQLARAAATVQRVLGLGVGR